MKIASLTEDPTMKRVAQPRSWLSEARPRPWSPSIACRARFSSPPAQNKESDQSDQHGQLPSQAHLEFNVWPQVDAEKKTIQTPLGELPISPFMDPTWQAAKQPSHKKEKHPPVKNMSRLRRNLFDDPYAKMLAEPVRMCQLTKARLPRAFLQSFGLVRNPKTEGENWWIAGYDSLPPKKFPKSTFEHQWAKKEGTEDRVRQIQGKLLAVMSEQKTHWLGRGKRRTTDEEEQEEPPPDPVPIDDYGRNNYRFRAPVHILSRQDLLASFHDRNSKYGGGHMRFAGHPSIGGLANNSVWRKDMHEMIADRLRYSIVAQLCLLAKGNVVQEPRGKALVVHQPMRSLMKSQSPDKKTVVDGDVPPSYLKNMLMVPPLAILRLPEPEIDDGKGDEGVAPAPSPILPFTLTDEVVPTYDLVSVLGPDFMKCLVANSPDVFTAQSPGKRWVTLRGKMFTDLIGKLWKLQGFLANYENLSETKDQLEKV